MASNLQAPTLNWPKFFQQLPKKWKRFNIFQIVTIQKFNKSLIKKLVVFNLIKKLKVVVDRVLFCHDQYLIEHGIFSKIEENA